MRSRECQRSSVRDRGVQFRSLLKVVQAVMVVGLMLVCAVPARGTSVPSIAPEQVVANADIIMQGVVVSATGRFVGATQRHIVTDYVFTVERVLRDEQQALAARTINGQVTLTFAGGTIGNAAVDAHGVPSFVVGERAFLFIKREYLGALAPTVGMWQGVYRVGPGAPGAERVTRVTSCCGASTIVESSFFSKTADRAGGFTVADFANEVARAVPLARGRQDLVLPSRVEGMIDMMNVEKPVLNFGRFHQELAQNAVDAGAGNARLLMNVAGVPVATNRSVQPPEVAQPFMISGEALDGGPSSQTTSLRYGFTRAPPNVPYLFNIAPNMGAFAGQFEGELAYWNSYASDVFRVYTSPNNSITGGNSRNETGFVTSATLNTQYGQPWAGEYAICFNYSLNNRIVESDICFNPAYTWTTDYTTGYNSGTSGSQIYFPPIALHEQGHSFGLDHSWVPNPGYSFPSIMNYYTFDMEAEARMVYADDAAGIRAAYPARIVNINDFGVYLWANTGLQSPGPNAANRAAWSTFPSSVTAGNNFTLTNFFLENVGTIAGSPTLEFYLTPTRGSFNGAIYCGSLAFGNFNSFAGGRYSATLSVPVGLGTGNYFVAAYKQGGDSYADNNSAWSNTRILVNAVPPPPAPGNDNLLNAYSISVGSVSGTTVNASNDRSGSCGLSNDSPDVWYRYYAAYDGVVEVDTCGSSLDTVLSMWSSSGFFSEVVCNDDAFLACGSRASRISFSMTAGTTRRVRVAGYNNATGTFVLNTRFTASNNLCSAATPVSTGTYFGYTTGSQAEPGDAQCGNSEATADIWYSYSAACSGTVQLNTFGSGFDTVLSVRTGCAGATFACNDDCSVVGPSCIDFVSVPGTTYIIRVSGYAGATGAVTLNVIANNFASNDECYNAAPVYDGLNSAYTQCATDSPVNMPDACATTPGEPLTSDVWFIYYPAVDGTVSVGACTGAFSPAVAVYDSACPGVPEDAIACGAGEFDCNTPLLSFTGLNGRYYYIRLGAANYGGVNGLGQGAATINITVVPFPTGACCAVDGSCSISSQVSCTSLYSGDDSVCEVVVCQVLLGACCAADLTCSIVLEAECVGTFRGAATVCEAVECLPLTGACCTTSVCTIVSADICAGASGAFRGSGTTCDFAGNPVTCCRANFNQQGGVSVQDIFDFLSGYFGGDIAADINDSGTVSVQDIFDFLSLYFAGCS